MGKRYAIEFSPKSRQEFGQLRTFDQRRVLEALENKLSNDPQVETYDRKCLGFEPANFNYVPPLWQLKAGTFRVFYEIDEAQSTVFILAVRPKPAHKTTSEVLNEADGD
jgi:mRNA-degrading endonuclease RelE of RelBE toxin-antitoxin system